MGQIRIALKLAARQARRQRLRTVAIVATLALPIAVVTGVDVVVRSTHLSEVATLVRQMGGTQAVVRWGGQAGRVTQSPTGNYTFLPPTSTGSANTYQSYQPVPSPTTLPPGLVPPGVTAYQEVDTGADLVSPSTGVPASIEGIDLTTPPGRGLVNVVTGRAPTGPDDIDLTRSLAHQLDAGVGSALKIPGFGPVLHVVGIAREHYAPQATQAYTLPALAQKLGSLGPQAVDSISISWYLSSEQPVTWGEVQRFNQSGFIVISRSVLQHPPSDVPFSTVPIVPEPGIGAAVTDQRAADQRAADVSTGVIGAMALLEVVLLAGPAFAVGARRRRYELALVSATGESGRHLIVMVAADGVVLGLIGAVIGAVVGIAGGAAVLAGLPHWTDTVPGSVQVRLLDVAGLALLAVLTGLLAALVPALSASRRLGAPVIRGRQDPARLATRPALLGLAAIVAAVLLAVTERHEQVPVGPPVHLVVAAALGEIGFALIAPGLLVLLGLLADRLPLWSRLALRDASRNRSAAAPAVAAIIAVVAATAALLVYGSSEAAHDRISYQPDALIGDASTAVAYPEANSAKAALTLLRADLPNSTVLDLRGDAGCGQAGSGPLVDQTSAGCRQMTVIPPEPSSCPPIQFQANGGDYSLVLGAKCAEVPIAGNDGSYLANDGATVRALVGGPGGAAAEQALDHNEAVVFSPELLSGGRVRLDMGPGQPSQVTLPAISVDNPTLALLFPVVIPPSIATKLDLPIGDLDIYVKDADRLPKARLKIADAGLAQLGFSGLEVESGFHDHISPILWAVAGGDLLLTIGAAIAATALIAVDDRQDLLTLAAVGAAPRARRRLSMARAGVICIVGALFGTLAGLLPGIGIVSRLRYIHGGAYGPPGFVYPPIPGYPLSIPWGNLALIALAAPVIAVLTAGLLTRARLPIERRRAT